MFVIVFYHIITNSVVCNFKSMKGYSPWVIRETRWEGRWFTWLNFAKEYTRIWDLVDWVATIVLLSKINNISSHKNWIAFTAPYQIKPNLIRDPFLGTRPFVGAPVADFNAFRFSFRKGHLAAAIIPDKAPAVAKWVVRWACLP